jgi:hypothetical protein
MKTLIITLLIWIFVVPAATALLLIFGFLAVIVPGCYFPCFFLVLDVLQLLVHLRAVFVFTVSL